MSTDNTLDEAVEVLQQLGLKEYEAKCFVGLSRLSTGTAKQLSEITDVPRTRVYDAVRVLEAQGLVEVQHSSPQKFRAVPLEEATETLRDQYEARVDRLTGALERTNPVEESDEDLIQEEYFTPYEPFGPEDATKQGVMTDMVSLSGGAEVVDVTVSSDAPLVDMTLHEANEQSLLDEEVLIIAIEREDEMLTPKGNTVIRAGDLVSVFARDGVPEATLDAFGETDRPLKLS